MSTIAAFQPVIVVPVYNHGDAIGRTLERLLPHGLPCLLVDDGSDAGCAAILDALASRHADRVSLLRLPENRGKGAAVIAGMQAAAQRGHSHVLQIDADGQHDTDDVPAFLAEARQWPSSIIAGRPVFDASVPASRLRGRYVTHLWVWINTLSFDIGDSMCGFRIYPLAPVLDLLCRTDIGQRMDFDIEIIVRLHWDGVPVRNRATRVTYPSDGVSHFDLWRDNLRISAAHARLFFGMLWRMPRLLWRKAVAA